VLGVRALIAAYPDSLPRSADVTIDAGVLAFTLVIGLLTARCSGSRRCCTLCRRDLDGAERRRHPDHDRSRTQPDPARPRRR
jgi:hypothetical protein